jgi:hypothetical protein
MPNSEPIELSGDAVTVHKSLRESVYPSPSVVIAIEHWGETPRTVTITESVPEDADATLVEFDSDTSDDWTARTDELVYTATIDAGEHIETAYTYAGGFEADRETWLSPPRVTVTDADGEETVLAVVDPGPTAAEAGSTPPTVTAVADGGEQRVAESGEESDEHSGSDEGTEHSESDDSPPVDDESDEYGSGLAYEPDQPEAVESGDVYGQQDANPSTDAVDVEPDSLYGEVEARWSAEDPNTVSSYGQQDAYEPDDDSEGSYDYGDSGIVEDDDEE